jgi:hypothetical protein
MKNKTRPANTIRKNLFTNATMATTADIIKVAKNGGAMMLAEETKLKCTVTMVQKCALIKRKLSRLCVTTMTTLADTGLILRKKNYIKRKNVTQH